MRRLVQAGFLVLGMVWSVWSLADGEVTKLWETSPHADISSPSFTHWDDEGLIPGHCASCHSGTGFLDYLGADGSAPLKMDKDHATGSVVDCLSCHHAEAEVLDSVPFPSGVVVGDIESSATCMVCHQGRSSTLSVMDKIEGVPEDSVSAELSFINIHYRAAAATLLGTEVKGGFEYQGQSYAGRFAHVEGLADCADCHNPHSLEVEQAECAQCHKEDTLADIRINKIDADADGDLTEGVASEINAIHSQLNDVIVEYASSVIDKPIVYDSHAYPYYFYDTNGNGVADGKEAIYPNRYQSWTPRLLKAAYNYQFVAKDPGAYAHNPTYVTQILIDSVNNINQRLGVTENKYQRPD